MQVTQDMVGHKLGEFAITKKRFTYKCVLHCSSCVRVENTHGVSQTYKEQVVELHSRVLVPTPWHHVGFTTEQMFGSRSSWRHDDREPTGLLNEGAYGDLLLSKWGDGWRDIPGGSQGPVRSIVPEFHRED